MKASFVVTNKNDLFIGNLSALFIIYYNAMRVYMFSCSVPDSLRPHGLQPTRLLPPWDSLGKSTGVGCHFLLQGIFPTQGSNPGLPHCRQTPCPLSHQGSGSRTGAPRTYEWPWAFFYLRKLKNVKKSKNPQVRLVLIVLRWTFPCLYSFKKKF